MARVSYSHRLDLGAVRALLTSPRGGVVRDLLRRGLRVESAAKRNLSSAPKRIDTGRLRASISTQVVTRDGSPAVIVGTNVAYARFVHDGTGLFGPLARRITPKRAKVMVWPGRGVSRRYAKRGGRLRGKVVARSTKGMRPNPFLAKALSAARD